MTLPPPALVATYRLQLRPGFGFGDAADLVDHLHELGVSHVCTSPVFDAVPGSTHGRDVVDHHLLNDELGGEEGFRRLVTALRERGLGLVIEVVPDHMAAHPRNEKWWDVLRFGRSSRYAHWFDLDWEHGTDQLPDRLLLTVLGDHYGAVMERGELRLDVVGDGMVIRYIDKVFPLSVPSVVEVLRSGFERIGDHRHDADLDEMRDLGDTFADHSEVLRRLAVMGRCWYGGDASMPCGHTSIDIDAVLDVINHDHDLLHEVLERQHYRLADARTSTETFDDGRFLDVTDVLGVKVEDVGVFDSTHGRLLQWVAAGEVQGLRIDHPDGLADPRGYLERLREHAPDAWIVVEKILGPGEELPVSWPVDGTTGYEVSALIDRLLVHPDGAGALDEFHAAQLHASTRHPLRMVSSSTHDSKRSEDVRARIAVLAEVPELWAVAVERLAARATALVDPASGIERDLALESTLHQNFFGAFPLDGDRAAAHALEAAREARRVTSWSSADEAFETSLTRSVRRWLADDEYVHVLRELVETTLVAARTNALAAKLLTLTVPGVPDLYQGSELWTDGLVDPDSRWPVDFELRRKLLADGATADGPLVLDDDGTAKLQVVRTALALRRRHPQAFGIDGGYEPVAAHGPAADHVVAFVRGGRVATVVPRFPARLHAAGGWRGTTVELPPGRWADVLAAAAHTATVPMEMLFAHRPVAVLERW
jgi:(1->4)-alpha-D-glucan 1-alpha-D-glucosylmutase